MRANARRIRILSVTRGSDRRVRNVRLTAKGRRKVLSARRYWESAQAELRAAVGARRFDRLLADLAHLIVALDNARDL